MKQNTILGIIAFLLSLIVLKLFDVEFDKLFIGLAIWAIPTAILAFFVFMAANDRVGLTIFGVVLGYAIFFLSLIFVSQFDFVENTLNNFDESIRFLLAAIWFGLSVRVTTAIVRSVNVRTS